MDLWRRRGGNLSDLVLSHNLSHRDATSQFYPSCEITTSPTPRLSTAAADDDHQDASFYSSLSPPRLGGRLGTRFIWNQKLILASFQNVHLGVDVDQQNQWDLNIGDHIVVETHHRYPLDVVVHQGGLGRGHFHLRTWGQSSRLVSLKMMGSRRWRWCFSTCWKDLLSVPRIVPNISHPHQVGEDGEDQSLAEASVDNCLILVSYSHD